MQSDNTARRSSAPENHPTPPATLPEPTPPESTIALGQSAIRKAIQYKKAILITGAIVLIAVCFYWLPTLATGLAFGGALFGINTLVDGKMGGRDDD